MRSRLRFSRYKERPAARSLTHNNSPARTKGHGLKPVLLFARAHFRSQASLRELHLHFCADFHLVRSAQHIARRIRADGIAALQNAQRAAFVEQYAQRLQALYLADQQSFDANTQLHGALQQAQAQRADLRAQVERCDPRGGDRVAVAQPFDAAFELRGKSRRQFVRLLAMPAQQILQPTETDVRGEVLQVVTILEQRVAHAL